MATDAGITTNTEQYRAARDRLVASIGDYAQAGPDIAERDGRPRERLPLDEVVLNWPV